MIRLIVNADDLGRGTATDRGIFRAVGEGIVTSVSLLANGASFTEAAREARTVGVPVGVHLNLAEGRSLTGEIRGLTRSNGDFPGKTESRRRLAAGMVEPSGIREELTAQIEQVLDAGLRPDHIDSHQHTFLFPQVADAALAIAGRFGIASARLPWPAEPEAADPGGSLGEELALYRRLAPATARTLGASGLFAPDGLWGMTFLNRLDEASLSQILRSLRAGTWELMVHPGCCDPADPFAGQEREAEVAALTSPAIRSLIGEMGIELTNFRELACAS